MRTLASTLGLLLVPALVGACRSPSPNVAVDSTGVPVLATADGALFGDVREQVAELASRHAKLRVEHGGGAGGASESVELAALDDDDLGALVVVRVMRAGAIVAGEPVVDDEAIALASSRGRVAAGGARFAVVRADSDAFVTDVMRVLRVVRTAGFAHTVLSAREPDARTPVYATTRGAVALPCGWPSRAPKSPVGAARALVRVGQHASGIGTVEVLSAPQGGFRQAAAFCASVATLPHRAEKELEIVVEFVEGDRFPCTTPGSDRMSQGAYTMNEVNATYGTLPSAGCDRFPR
ncbi:MAG: hypothetical protein JST00_03915 [Deltaproteobacteria bacterium]|nr:hypothetical protein [Deltaproteobacteria bacterium]